MERLGSGQTLVQIRAIQVHLPTTIAVGSHIWAVVVSRCLQPFGVPGFAAMQTVWLSTNVDKY